MRLAELVFVGFGAVMLLILERVVFSYLFLISDMLVKDEFLQTLNLSSVTTYSTLSFCLTLPNFFKKITIWALLFPVYDGRHSFVLADSRRVGDIPCMRIFSFEMLDSAYFLWWHDRFIWSSIKVISICDVTNLLLLHYVSLILFLSSWHDLVHRVLFLDRLLVVRKTLAFQRAICHAGW